MDAVRADGMSKELCGQSIGGWFISRYINFGKTGVVFQGEKDGNVAALKVFDKETTEKFGKDSQLARIACLLRLRGEHHPNLVDIFDGGECPDTGYVYLAMELIEAPNLEECLTLIPPNKIQPIIAQIASAAKFLEAKELAHGDIKPENIVVLPDFSRAVLLDLCTLRPFGDPNFTEADQKVFIATLRYSSPEYLLRSEANSIEGLRAVTFYQLGAVLHDMIMREVLFKEYSEPFALLVEAVINKKPDIYSHDVSADAVLLAQNCLVKSPQARLALVTWQDFEFVSDVRSLAESVRERVMKRGSLHRTQNSGVTGLQSRSLKQVAKQIVWVIDKVIRDECAGNPYFPPMKIVHNTEIGMSVTVVFASSSELELVHDVSVSFSCTVVDQADLAVTIDASAWVGLFDPIYGVAPSPTCVFRGPIMSASLAASIQSVLWCSIDAAQRQGPIIEMDAKCLWLSMRSLEAEI